MEASQLGLSLTYALHLLATVAWIGGLLYQSLFLIPALHKIGDSNLTQALFERLRSRFQPIAWLSLAVLVGTGLIQMAAHPEYNGFLAIDSTWAKAILLKHTAIVLMILIAGYQSFALYPMLTRRMILQKKTMSSQPQTKPVASESVLIRLNILLSLIVLLLTAIARTA